MINLNKKFENRYIGAAIIGFLIVLIIILIIVANITIHQIDSGKHVKMPYFEWNIPDTTTKTVYKHDTVRIFKYQHNDIQNPKTLGVVHSSPAKSKYQIGSVSQSAIGDHAVNNNWIGDVKPRVVDESELDEILKRMGMDKKANKTPGNNIKLYSSTVPETIRFMKLVKIALTNKGYIVGAESGSYGPQQMPGNFWIVAGSSENAIYILDAKVDD